MAQGTSPSAKNSVVCTPGSFSEECLSPEIQSFKNAKATQIEDPSFPASSEKGAPRPDEKRTMLDKLEKIDL